MIRSDTYDGRAARPRQAGKARCLLTRRRVQRSADRLAAARPVASHARRPGSHQATVSGANAALGRRHRPGRLELRNRRRGGIGAWACNGTPERASSTLGADLAVREAITNEYQPRRHAARRRAAAGHRHAPQHACACSCQYALQPNLALGVRPRLRRRPLPTPNDWTWTGWTYADGTTVRPEPRGRTNFVGISVEYRQW